MKEIFKIDQRLLDDSYNITDLTLCNIRLFNTSLFPWILLIPKRSNIKEIIELEKDEQLRLMEEITLVSQVVKQKFSPDKLNIAAFGNLVPQLHIHIIARYTSDTAWPDPAFGKKKLSYEAESSKKIIKAIQEGILNHQKN